MLIYFLCFCTIPIYGLFIKNRKVLVSLIGIQIFLLLACRNEGVGYDLSVYKGAFEYIKSLSFFEMVERLNFISTADLIYPYNLESGYVFFNWIIGSIGFTFHDFLIIQAAVNITIISLFIYNYSKSIWMSFMLFCCLGMYNSMFGLLRHSLAMCILLLSVPFILKKNSVKFFLVVTLAFLIHRSAIIFIPIYYLYNIKVRKEFLLKYGLIALLLIYPLGYVLDIFVVPLLSIFDKVGYSSLQLKYNNLILLLFIILILVVMFANFRYFTEKIDNLTIWGFLLSFPIEIVGMYNEVLGRSLPFYFIFICLLIPKIIKEYKVQETRMVVYLVLPVVLLMFEMYTIYGTPMYPYVFFL